MLARLLKIACALTLSLLLTGAISADAAPVRHDALGQPRLQTPAPTGVVVLKLRAGAMERKADVLPALADLARPYVGKGTIEPRFAGLQKALADPDLARYHCLRTEGLTVPQLRKLAASLDGHPAVEVAFLEPVAVPAALGFDAFTGAVPEAATAGGDLTLQTPDFESQQGYLDDAPLGVGALSLRTEAGALGAGVTIVDVEGGWLWSHEDLPTPVIELGVQVEDLSWRNHGTAVMGEMRGEDNGIGVSGIATQCDVGNASIGGGAGTAWALAAAMEALQPGDLMLIELHAPGPNATGFGQFGYVPMEYWPDNFDLIRAATARGIIVCEAAGNGYQNLDDAVYEGLFDRNVRDSGAIMCGATAGSDLFSADFSNNGTRVDLNGWGWYVTTCGYGDLQNGLETEWYTGQFSGTSSASPIVTGSVASFQGMFRERLGFDLDARLARDLLRETGTAMISGNQIGTRPNLVAAIAHADTVAGRIIGHVTDQDSGLPVAGAWVQVGDTGSFTLTDDQGYYALPLDARSGSATLTFSSYYYESATTSPALIGGTTVVLDLALAPLTLIDIRGRVSGPAGPLAGVFVTPTDQPVTGVVSDAAGDFVISGVPALYDFGLLFEGAAGHGAHFEVVSTAGLTGDAVTNPVLPAITEHFQTPGAFTADSELWSHATPPASVTGGAFAGFFCWGVGMDANYPDDVYGTLTSPPYDLSGVAGQPYYLSFHYYSATEAAFDGANVEFEVDGQWVLAEPMEGYPDPSLGGLGNEPGWSGNSGRWQGTVFDISDHTAAGFRFRINFGSDGSANDAGFFIDGLAFASDLNVSAVPGDDLPTPAVAGLHAWPNPFNPQVSIAWAIPEAGDLRVHVMDLRGHHVRTLLEAPVGGTTGQVVWNGRDDQGRQAASGVYLVRLEGPKGALATQRVVLAK